MSAIEMEKMYISLQRIADAIENLNGTLKSLTTEAVYVSPKGDVSRPVKCLRLKTGGQWNSAVEEVEIALLINTPELAGAFKK